MNRGNRIDRRAALLGSAGLVATGLFAADPVAAADPPQRTSMGLVIYCRGFLRQAMRQRNAEFDLFRPLPFLQHVHALGAGGMQANLGVLEVSEVRQLTTFAERHGLFIDAMVQPPQDASDLARFEREIQTARDVGALAVRTTIMPGRRYEQFKSLAEFRESQQRGQRMLEWAVPVLEKHRVRLAVENHKDERVDERVALLRHLDCEFIGACVDTGNSFALLDDPYGTIDALAPYAFTVHLKDQALREYPDGFLLGDVPLGQGAFDLPRMVATLRKAHPGIRFVLELITRDALPVPCLREDYWSTLPQVPGSDLARTLRIVREHPAERLQQVHGLALDQQLALEDANLRASLDFGIAKLGL